MARPHNQESIQRCLTLADLIEGLGGIRPAGLELPVSLVIDSRKAKPGAVFLAFRGENVDGHAFVGDAFARGAVAAVVDAAASAAVPLDEALAVSAEVSILDLTQVPPPSVAMATPVIIRVPDVLQGLQRAAAFWRQQFDVRVIGITGSVGKTTTKEATTRVLQQRYRVLHSTGSYNNEIGLPLTLLQLTSEHEVVVLEMGMYVQGDIRSLAEIARPQIGILTNVEPVHAERAGTLENIALGKRELVEALPPAPEGLAILNYDDARVRAMAEGTQARVFTYGLDSKADLWADEVESLGLEGIRAQLHYGQRSLHVCASLLGRHSIHTLLRAAAVGLALGLSWEEIVAGIELPGAQLRLVSVQGPRQSLVLDDTYNSSPPSALAALNLLADLGGRGIAVLGDMLELGQYEEEGHLTVGCRTASVAEHLVAVGPRGALIARGARSCGMPPERVHEVANNAEALACVLALLEPNTVILVKGSRAMRMEEIVHALARDRVGADLGVRPLEADLGVRPLIHAMLTPDATVVILGFARQGKALARYFAEQGVSVVVSDRRSSEALAADIAELDALPIRYVLGAHPESLLDNCTLLYLSGGVSADLPLVVEAQRRGIPVSNDAEEFLKQSPAPVLGITGSAGKTTTTALVGAILREAGFQTWVGGNIGNPLISDLARMTLADRVVMELSSFQLELMSCSPHIAAVLNITPNHLDRHKTMEAYIAAKAHIVTHQNPGDVAVLGFDEPNARGLAHLTPAQVRYFSGSTEVATGAFLRGETLILRREGQELEICHRRDIRLRGFHNTVNTLAAVVLSDVASASVEAMRRVIMTFTGVEHRLEPVRRWRNVLWVNDSIATAPERVLAGLAAFDEPLVLLAGGRDKDLFWETFAVEVVRRVRVLVLFGEAMSLIDVHVSRALAEATGPRQLEKIIHAATLEKAVSEAARWARPGEVVLLSPGGTSFDAFRDFAERGERFRTLVNALG